MENFILWAVPKDSLIKDKIVTSIFPKQLLQAMLLRKHVNVPAKISDFNQPPISNSIK